MLRNLQQKMRFFARLGPAGRGAGAVAPQVGRTSERWRPIPEDAQSTFASTSQATFANIFVPIVLLCVFPVTTCTCERSVSTLRRVKTFLRTETGEDLLSSLSLLTTYRDIKFDLEQVIDKFASEKRRKVEFTHPQLPTGFPELY